MEKTIKSADLVEQYNSYATDALKDKFLKDTIKTEEYIPFATKLAIAQNIVNHGCYPVEIDSNGNTVKDENDKAKLSNNLHINSALYRIFKLYSVIDWYTNIELNKDVMIHEEYDLLNRYGLIEKILGFIPESELKELSGIIDSTFDDLLQNEYEIHGFITKQVGRITDVLGVLLDPIKDTFGEILKDVSVDDLKHILEGINKGKDNA